jgi:hypothetical protein
MPLRFPEALSASLHWTYCERPRSTPHAVQPSSCGAAARSISAILPFILYGDDRGKCHFFLLTLKAYDDHEKVKRLKMTVTDPFDRQRDAFLINRLMS